MRCNDNRWSRKTLSWSPRIWEEKKGRPNVRWADDIKATIGDTCSKNAPTEPIGGWGGLCSGLDQQRPAMMK